MSSWTNYIIWVGFCCEFCLFYGPTCLKFLINGRDITLGTVKWFGERVPFWRSELGPSGFCAAVLCIVEMMILFSICFFFQYRATFFSWWCFTDWEDWGQACVEFIDLSNSVIEGYVLYRLLEGGSFCLYYCFSLRSLCGDSFINCSAVVGIDCMIEICAMWDVDCSNWICGAVTLFFWHGWHLHSQVAR